MQYENFEIKVYDKKINEKLYDEFDITSFKNKAYLMYLNSNQIISNCINIDTDFIKFSSISTNFIHPITKNFYIDSQAPVIFSVTWNKNYAFNENDFLTIIQLLSNEKLLKTRQELIDYQNTPQKKQVQYEETQKYIEPATYSKGSYTELFYETKKSLEREIDRKEYDLKNLKNNHRDELYYLDNELKAQKQQVFKEWFRNVLVSYPPIDEGYEIDKAQMMLFLDKLFYDAPKKYTDYFNFYAWYYHQKVLKNEVNENVYYDAFWIWFKKYYPKCECEDYAVSLLPSQSKMILDEKMQEYLKQDDLVARREINEKFIALESSVQNEINALNQKLDELTKSKDIKYWNEPKLIKPSYEGIRTWYKWKKEMVLPDKVIDENLDYNPKQAKNLYQLPKMDLSEFNDYEFVGLKEFISDDIDDYKNYLWAKSQYPTNDVYYNYFIPFFKMWNEVKVTNWIDLVKSDKVNTSEININLDNLYSCDIKKYNPKIIIDDIAIDEMQNAVMNNLSHHNIINSTYLSEITYQINTTNCDLITLFSNYIKVLNAMDLTFKNYQITLKNPAMNQWLATRTSLKSISDMKKLIAMFENKQELNITWWGDLFKVFKMDKDEKKPEVKTNGYDENDEKWIYSDEEINQLALNQPINDVKEHLRYSELEVTTKKFFSEMIQLAKNNQLTDYQKSFLLQNQVYSKEWNYKK